MPEFSNERLTGINRNIVECKDTLTIMGRKDFLGINRNIVECKGATAVTIHAVNHFVLIETLWNVKHCSPVVSAVLRTVLIETLWNVKFRPLREFHQ